MRTVALADRLLSAACSQPSSPFPPSRPRAPSRALDGRERAIVRGINHQRARYGLAPVRSSGRLARAADYHSWEMLDAELLRARVARRRARSTARVRRYVNYRALGETLAMVGGCGAAAARRIVRMWMNSPGHRAILLSSSFRRVGARASAPADLGRQPRRASVTADFARESNSRERAVAID